MGGFRVNGDLGSRSTKTAPFLPEGFHVRKGLEEEARLDRRCFVTEKCSF